MFGFMLINKECREAQKKLEEEKYRGELEARNEKEKQEIENQVKLTVEFLRNNPAAKFFFMKSGIILLREERLVLEDGIVVRCHAINDEDAIKYITTEITENWNNYLWHSVNRSIP